MNEIRTSWCNIKPQYGTFDDYVIIESLDLNERVLIRPEEFDFITIQLYDNWILGKSKYIQLLKEWNECIGFNYSDENVSIVLDNEDTMEAIKQLKGIKKIEFAKVTEEDLKLILAFLIRNKGKQLKIWKE